MSSPQDIGKHLPQARLHRVLDRFGYDEEANYGGIRRYSFHREHSYGMLHTHPKGHWVHIDGEGEVGEIGHGHASLHRYLKSMSIHQPEE